MMIVLTGGKRSLFSCAVMAFEATTFAAWALRKSGTIGILSLLFWTNFGRSGTIIRVMPACVDGGMFAALAQLF